MRVEAYANINQLYQASKPMKLQKQDGGKKNDTLEISNFGKEYNIAKKAALDAPEIREDKISAIKNAMANGTYPTSSEYVADKLLEKYL